jgi:hypothetical protein
VDAVRNFIETNKIPDFARFRENRVSRMELSILMCGYYVSLTDRGLPYRFTKLAVGFMARHLMPSDLNIGG